MPFNSGTYQANKYRRKALAELDRARDIKARAAAGKAYEWEIERIAFFAGNARRSWRIMRLTSALRWAGSGPCTRMSTPGRPGSPISPRLS